VGAGQDSVAVPDAQSQLYVLAFEKQASPQFCSSSPQWCGKTPGQGSGSILVRDAKEGQVGDKDHHVNTIKH
jgi:hypothetical protein